MSVQMINLSCRFGAHQALKNLSLQISNGECVGIMGQTGCGKSTLLRLMAGLIPPTEGQILLDGTDIYHPRFPRKLLRQTIGLVFQYPESQLFETTVERDVAFGLKHTALSKQEKEKQIRWALEEMGFDFETIRARSPLSLSGGEKRRVAIAGILAADPALLILDEPFAGLDPLGRRALIATLKRLHAAGKTVVLVSHNADLLCELTQRIIVLKEGTLAADGTPEEVFADLDAAAALHIGAGSIRRIAQGLYERGFLADPTPTTQEALVAAILQRGGDRP